MLEIVIVKVVRSIWECYLTVWSLPLSNVKWHSEAWSVTVTSQPIILYTIGNLVPPLLGTCIWSNCWDDFSWACRNFPNFSLRISLGTFSIRTSLYNMIISTSISQNFRSSIFARLWRFYVTAHTICQGLLLSCMFISSSGRDMSGNVWNRILGFQYGDPIKQEEAPVAFWSMTICSDTFHLSDIT